MQSLIYGWDGWQTSDCQDIDELKQKAERGLFAFKYSGEKLNPGWFRVAKVDGVWKTERVQSFGASKEFDDLYNSKEKDSTDV